MVHTLNARKPLSVKILHLFPASIAHKLGKAVLENRILSKYFLRNAKLPRDDRLRINVAGIELDNPLGLAAGYDKDGELYRTLGNIGLGFHTIGSVTFRPREGNKKKVLIRLEEELGMINSLGLPSKGFSFIVKFLEQLRESGGSPIFLSIAPTNEKELEIMLRELEKFEKVKAVEVNVSCPNVFDNLDIDKALSTIRAYSKPIFLKLGLWQLEGLEELIDICKKRKIGLSVLNALKVERGGLSGMPLYPYTLKAVRRIRELSKDIPVIAVGGVFNGRQAIELIKAGADAIGILTALAYLGPQGFKKIAEEMLEILKAEGFKDLKEVRGYKVEVRV